MTSPSPGGPRHRPTTCRARCCAPRTRGQTPSPSPRRWGSSGATSCRCRRRFPPSRWTARAPMTSRARARRWNCSPARCGWTSWNCWTRARTRPTCTWSAARAATSAQSPATWGARWAALAMWSACAGSGRGRSTWTRRSRSTASTAPTSTSWTPRCCRSRRRWTCRDCRRPTWARCGSRTATPARCLATPSSGPRSWSATTAAP